MKLSVDNAARYLLEHGVVAVATIVDGSDFVVIDCTRRNRNFRVLCGSSRGYLVKQPDTGEPLSEQTFRTEAAFYSLCQTEARAAEMSDIMPRLFGYHQGDGVLILELVEGAVPLWQHYASQKPPSFPKDPGSALGHALAAFHNLFRLPAFETEVRLSSLHRTPPWILWVHKPGPEILERISPANLETLKILQKQASLSPHLDALRKEWRVEALIHGDVKGDNVLVRSPGSTGGEVSIRLVDWELIQYGDPAWDVAGAFADYLLFWIASIPVSSTRTPDEMLAAGAYPLSSLQPAIRAFWNAYRDSVHLGQDDALTFLRRSIRYCAARLIQSAYEQSNAAAVLSNQAVVLLQVSANVLADPDSALLHLLGIPPAGLFARLVAR